MSVRESLIENNRSEPVEFQIGSDFVYGILHHPQKQNLMNNKLVVFLHGWIGYRTGPHDMFVKMARSLSSQGFYCLRFDFRGRGYSVVSASFRATYRSMLDDLNSVLRQIDHRLPGKNVSLVGICSGAKVGLGHVRSDNNRAENVVLLSCPLLSKEQALGTDIRKLKSFSAEYGKKLQHIETVRRLIKGEVNVGLIMRAFMRMVTGALTRLISFAGKAKPSTVNGAGFRNFKGRVLAIYGERDPETKGSLSQLQTVLKRYSVEHDVSIIEGANHSFYSLAWEQEITEKVSGWLMNISEK